MLRKRFSGILALMLMFSFVNINTASAEDYGSCSWVGEAGTSDVTCTVGSIITGEPTTGYIAGDPTIAEITISNADYVTNFPLATVDPNQPTITYVDPSTINTYVNIDYSILTADENDSYTVHFLVDGVESSYTTTTNVTFTIDCANGYTESNGTCSEDNVEEPAPTTETPSTTQSNDTSHGTGFEKGAIQDGQARTTIIVSILIVLISLGLSIYLYIRFGWRDTNLRKPKVGIDQSNLKNEKEIEFKTELTFEEYDKLLKLVRQTEKYEILEQTNWYFDTKNMDNIQQGIAVRIRRQNNEYELCVKIKHDTYNNETNIILDEETALKYINKKKLNLADFNLDHYIENSKLIYVTKLQNLRCEFINEQATIALDHSKYGEVKIFELELEYPYYESGKIYFEQYLSNNNITYKPILPKVARAFEEYKNSVK